MQQRTTTDTRGSSTSNEASFSEAMYDATVHRAQFFAESAELFLVFDSSYVVVDANLTALRWFGKTRETMEEISMPKLCHPDHLQHTYKAMAESAAHTNLVLHASGTYRWLSWRPIKSHSGFFYAAGRDVTSEIEDRSNAESFIRLLCHEIRNPLLGIIGVSDVLMAQHSSLEDMIAREPNATTHLAQLEESIDTIRKCCDQLNSVVNTTLNVSKLESGKSELVMGPFQPHTVLQASVDVMMGLAMGRRVRLQVSPLALDMDSAFQYYWGDQAWLSQVLVNLLSNAVKFTREGGQVTASAQVTEREDEPSPKENDSKQDEGSKNGSAGRKAGPILVGASRKERRGMQDMDKQVVFTVQDTGVGMSDAQCKNLFQPFLTGQATSSVPGISVTNYSNCGLGLHISHSVVTRMGGTIEVMSELGVGTCVRVKVPTRVCDPASVCVGGERNPPPHLTTSTSTGTFPSMNILVVDDVPLNRKIAIRFINEMGKHNTLEACDGVSCLQTLKSMVREAGEGNGKSKQPPVVDLILMDVSMPGIDGLETTRRLRSLFPPDGQPYVSGVSAFSSEQDRLAALEAGMDTYLIKPYQKFDLLRVLWEASERQKQPRTLAKNNRRI